MKSSLTIPKLKSAINEIIRRNYFWTILFIGMLFTLKNAYTQNVGIGISSPQEKLHVGGYIRSNPLASADTSLVIADQAGTLKILPFPNDSTQVLRGNATWGNISSNVFGSFIYPDGFSNLEGITLNQLLTNNYTVPAGKNLYVTNIYSIRNDDFLSFSGLRLHYGFSNFGFDNQAQHLSGPLIASSGEVISASSDTLLINGFLIPANVVPITLANLSSSPYTVPVGQIMVITNCFSLGTTSGLTVNGQRVQYGLSSYGAKGQFQHLEQPLFLKAGDILSANDNTISINAYLRAP